MASQTRTSVALAVTLGILGVLCLGLLVTSIVLSANVQRLSNELAVARNDLSAAVRPDERDDRWEQLRSQAGNQGVVRYLDRSLQDLAAMVSGSRRDDPRSLLDKVTAASGEDATPLIPLLTSRREEISRLQQALAAAEANRDAARADLLASVERVRSLEEEHRATVERISGEIETYRAGTTTYRDSVEAAKRDYTTRLETLRSDSESTVSGLEGRVRSLEQELLIANDQVRRFKQAEGAQGLRPADEGALVDARVAGVNSAARQVYLDIGRRERVVLGMSFEVYTGASAIQPDAAGEYPRGKATIEVIRIDEASSVARIIRENAGTPIISGDVVANAVYDPRKRYTFAIYGNFDTDRDGIATPLEAQDIRGLIENWNGAVSEDITGDTDFLVLGEKPILPPQPRPSDPVELIQRYLQLRQQVTKYDELFERATAAGIPILNQNRLYTLTGVHAGR
ncbi:MAG: hypothetical protein SFZ24_08055 [Planctomycetota bacterium]|nr:hypothetical protein [Planctomycetota bacterium]